MPSRPRTGSSFWPYVIYSVAPHQLTLNLVARLCAIVQATRFVAGPHVQAAAAADVRNMVS
eukprot:1136521-Pelagomonas_calceolata.AAC.3